MKFIKGTNRYQVEIYTRCLDETIEKENEVRLIDLFVDSLNLKDFGFDMEFVDNGVLVIFSPKKGKIGQVPMSGLCLSQI